MLITRIQLAGYFHKFEFVTISAVEFIVTQWNSEFTCKMIKINLILVKVTEILHISKTKRFSFFLSFFVPLFGFVCCISFVLLGGGVGVIV